MSDDETAAFCEVTLPFSSSLSTLDCEESRVVLGDIVADVLVVRLSQRKVLESEMLEIDSHLRLDRKSYAYQGW